MGEQPQDHEQPARALGPGQGHGRGMEDEELGRLHVEARARVGDNDELWTPHAAKGALEAPKLLALLLQHGLRLEFVPVAQWKAAVSGVSDAARKRPWRVNSQGDKPGLG